MAGGQAQLVEGFELVAAVNHQVNRVEFSFFFCLLPSIFWPMTDKLAEWTLSSQLTNNCHNSTKHRKPDKKHAASAAGTTRILVTGRTCCVVDNHTAAVASQTQPAAQIAREQCRCVHHRLKVLRLEDPMLGRAIRPARVIKRKKCRSVTPRLSTARRPPKLPGTASKPGQRMMSWHRDRRLRPKFLGPHKRKLCVVAPLAWLL